MTSVYVVCMRKFPISARPIRIASFEKKARSGEDVLNMPRNLKTSRYATNMLTQKTTKLRSVMDSAVIRRTILLGVRPVAVKRIFEQTSSKVQDKAMRNIHRMRYFWMAVMLPKKD